jgi:hypothetical protein
MLLYPILLTMPHLDLDEDEDDSVFMDVRDVGDRGGEDTSEFLDALEDVEDFSIIGKLSQMEECMLKSLHFRQLGSPPPPDKWGCRCGTVSTIASAINFIHAQREKGLSKSSPQRTKHSLLANDTIHPGRAPRDPNISANCRLY